MRDTRQKKMVTAVPAKARQPFRGLVAFFFILSVLFSFAFPSLPEVMAAQPATLEIINRVGYTTSPNGSALRTLPYFENSVRLDYLLQGTKVEVFTRVAGSSYQSSTDWYYVRDVKGDRMGYVHSKLVKLTEMPVEPPVPSSDPDFEAHLTAQGFPESYKPALRRLHDLHPNWTFSATRIIDKDTIHSTRQTLSFPKALNIQADPSVPARSLVSKHTVLSHRLFESPGYDYMTDTWTSYDAGGWYRASREFLAYSMDPRNFLEEGTIFQFEQLSYDPSVHNLEAVTRILEGTFMDKGEVITFTDLGGTTRSLTYPEIFMDAAEMTGVNPYFLAQRCLTEVGRNGSDSVLTNNREVGYENIYNFYNIGATAGASPITSGLRFARYGATGDGPTQSEKDKYLLPWDNPWRAIVGGAKWIDSGYIAYGQDTSYSQKFHLDGSLNGTYWHQYMGNVAAPANESGRVFFTYLSNDLLSGPFTFKIPVLRDLPEEPAPYPADNLSRNNWLKSVTTSKGTLSPAFHPEKYEYSLTVDGTDNRLTLSASPCHSTCTVINAGTITLQPGQNKIVLQAVSQSGHIRPYTLNVNFTGQASADPPPSELGDGYQLKGNLIANAWPADGRNRADRIIAGLNLTDGYSARVFDLSGKELGKEATLGTGARIDVYYQGQGTPVRSYQLVIYGDANGDAVINAIDLSYIIDSMVKGKRWAEAQNAALDVNRDGSVNAIDLSYVIDSMVRGKIIRQD